MLRKKKKQSERELELSQVKDELPRKDGSDMDAANEPGLIHMNHPENDAYQNEDHHDAMEDIGTSKGQLDLNSHPNREDDMQPETPGTCTPSLVNTADLPSRMYNLATTTGKCLLSQATEESKGNHAEDRHITPIDTKAENKAAEG